MIVLPGVLAVASGLLVWFVMRSRMEAKLAEQRAALEAGKKAIQATLPPAARTTPHTPGGR